MKQERKTEIIFLVISAFNICVMYVLLLASKGNYIQAFTYSESNFTDFWSHIGRLLYSPAIYATDADAIFPPLAYLFLKLFAQPLRFKAENGNELWEISDSGYGILMIVMYFTLFAWLLGMGIHVFYKTDSFVKKQALLGIFLFSYSVWGFAFERGNLVLYAMVFLMLGLALKDSPNKLLREAALILIAVSAGFKLYPALFGFIWIAEKRYKEAARLVVYGLAAFFIPFLFVDSFTNYFHTFMQYLNKGMYSHASIWGAVFELLGNNGYTQMLCRGIVVAIILGSLYFLFADGINWKTITLLMATQTVMIPEQYVYTYVFIMIPLICFLNESGKRKIDYAYAVLFSSLFTLPPIFKGGRGRLMVWIWGGVVSIGVNR